MNSPKPLFLLLTLILLAGCNSLRRSDRAELSSPTKTTTAESFGDTKNQGRVANEPNQNLTQVSLKQADQSQSMAEAMNRKILRNAELRLEVAAAIEAQRKITSIAESLGGFVVTSESTERQNANAATQDLEVNLVIRVPAPQFGAALEQIRSAGTRVIQEKTTGEDVTEEFIDLEARIKTQRRSNFNSWRS